MSRVYSISIAYNNKDWKVYKKVSELNSFFENLRKLEREIRISLKDPSETISTYISRLRADLTEELLNSFLVFLLSAPEVVSSQFFREFIEFSWHSDTQAKKYKEGYVTLTFEEENSTCSWLCCLCCCGHCRGHSKRWLILSEDSLGYTNSFTEKDFQFLVLLREVTEILTDERVTGFPDGILVVTRHVKFTFLAGSVEKKQEWIRDIKEVLEHLAPNYGKILYGSSFPLRDKNLLKWFINGQDYYQEVYSSLLSATEEVFIADWWFCPQLYLLRPSVNHPNSQVVQVLKLLADCGIKIYVLMYEEFVNFRRSMDSRYNEKVLKSLIHKNIQVLRHPNHALIEGTIFWTHHEKMLVIDQSLAFFGGLDLCYSRYDTREHRLVDNVKPYTWNGIDYHNSRIKGFEEIVDYKKEQIDRETQVRMPWHDTSLCVRGSAARDLASHFIEYWNYVVTEEGGPERNQQSLLQPARNRSEVEILVSGQEEVKVPPPQTSRNIDSHVYALHKRMQEDETRLISMSPSLKTVRKLDLQPKALSQTIINAMIKPKLPVAAPEESSCVCELVRSANHWSLGLAPHECSIHEAYLTLIEQSQHYIYIENQYFISSTAGAPIVNTIAQALVDRILRAASAGQKFMVFVLLPLLPDATGNIFDSSAFDLRLILNWEHKTISRGHSSVFGQLQRAGVDPQDYIRFYSLRTHEVLNGNPVTEQIYIHCKVMIVDDDVAIVGSANVNDRSMAGSRDSEIAMVIRDLQKVDSQMGGLPWKCGKFTLGLRMALFREFMGDEHLDVGDPIGENFLRVVRDNAWNNTELYREVFGCYPDDGYSTYDNVEKKANEMKSEQGMQRKREYYQRYSSGFKGILVEFPHKFLSGEDLEGNIFSVENLMPTVLVT